MIYQATITTPKQTFESNKQKTVLTVNKGLVHRIEVLFPSGSAGLLRCQIFDRGYQAWPTTAHEWFRGDDDVISFDDTYLKSSPPYEFNIFTYNLDDTYEHDVIVRIGLVSEKVFMARFLPTMTWEFFQEMLRDLQVTQNNKNQGIIDQPFSWV